MTNESAHNRTNPDRSVPVDHPDSKAVGDHADNRHGATAACGGEAVHGDWRLDGTDRAAEEYAAQAREFLERSRVYLAEGHLHQASEKGWGAAAHMAKAVALTQGWVYETHSDFSVVMNNAHLRLGEDRIRPLRAIANELHGNFYKRKRFLNADEIGGDLDSVTELLDALAPLATPA